MRTADARCSGRKTILKEEAYQDAGQFYWSKVDKKSSDYTPEISSPRY